MERATKVSCYKEKKKLFIKNILEKSLNLEKF